MEGHRRVIEGSWKVLGAVVRVRGQPLHLLLAAVQAEAAPAALFARRTPAVVVADGAPATLFALYAPAAVWTAISAHAGW